jgi:hypothetical protein
MIPMAMYQDDHHQIQKCLHEAPIYQPMQLFQQRLQKLPALLFQFATILLFLGSACTLNHE